MTEESDDGEWVLFEDANAEIERLTTELHTEQVANKRLQEQANIFEDKCEALTAESTILRKIADYAKCVTEGGGPGSHLGLDQALEDWQNHKARVSGSRKP